MRNPNPTFPNRKGRPLTAGATREPIYSDVRYPPKTAYELAKARPKSEPHAACARLLGPKVSLGVAKAFRASDYTFGEGIEPRWLEPGGPCTPYPR